MGLIRCSYLNCVYKSNEQNMFRFPAHNQRRLNEWLINCGNRRLFHLPVKQLYGRYVCFVHFDKKFIQNEDGIRMRLSKTAVPRSYLSCRPPRDSNSLDRLDLLYEDKGAFSVKKPLKCYFLKRKNTRQKPPKIDEALIKQNRLEAQRDTTDIDLPKTYKDYTRLPPPVSTKPSDIPQSSIRYHKDKRGTVKAPECVSIEDSTQECDDDEHSSSKCDDDQSEVNICRICLQSFSKLISMESYNLRTAYEQLTGVSVEHDDGLPQELCVECATLLDKYYKFREKSIKGDQLLRQIYNKDGVTIKVPLEDIDKAICSLASSIDFSPEVTCIDIPPTNLTNNNFKILVNNPADAKIEVDNNPNDARIDVDNNPNEAEEDQKNNPEIIVADLDMAVDDQEHFEPEYSANEDPLDSKFPNTFEFEMPLIIKQENVSEDETDPLNMPLPSRNSYSKTRNYENILLNDNFVIKKLNAAAQKSFHAKKQMENDYVSCLFQCQSCYDGFGSLDELKEHGLYHNPERGKVVCDICKIRYSHKIELRAHTEEMHLYSFCCTVCDHLLHTRQLALDHLKNH